MHKIGWLVGILAVVILLAMQVRRPNYDLSPASPEQTMEAQLHPSAPIQHMLQQSCYSCHSAQVEIPWYGHVWPTSHLLQNDVRRGRARLDFSNWANLSPEMSRIRLLDACRMMREARMPLWYYRPMHPGSAPRPEEIDAFCSWTESPHNATEVAQLR
jgi:Haem-binding domain